MLAVPRFDPACRNRKACWPGIAPADLGAPQGAGEDRSDKSGPGPYELSAGERLRWRRGQRNRHWTRRPKKRRVLEHGVEFALQLLAQLSQARTAPQRNPQHVHIFRINRQQIAEILAGAE